MNATMSKKLAKVIGIETAPCGLGGFDRAQARIARLLTTMTAGELAAYWTWRATQATTLAASEHCQRMAQRARV